MSAGVIIAMNKDSQKGRMDRVLKRMLSTPALPHEAKRGPAKPNPRSPSRKKGDEDRSSTNAGGDINLQSDHDSE